SRLHDFGGNGIGEGPPDCSGGPLLGAPGKLRGASPKPVADFPAIRQRGVPAWALALAFALAFADALGPPWVEALPDAAPEPSAERSGLNEPACCWSCPPPEPAASAAPAAVSRAWPTVAVALSRA